MGGLSILVIGSPKAAAGGGGVLELPITAHNWCLVTVPESFSTLTIHNVHNPNK